VEEGSDDAEDEEDEEQVVGPTYNVSMIFASLNHPQDFKYFIQNYSRFEYHVLLAPGQQATFNYKFRPDALLEPREFAMLFHVVYVDLTTNITHFHTFFNNTIEIVEPYTVFDVQLLFTYTLIIGILGLIGFALYNKFGTSKKSSRAVVEQSARKVNASGEVEIENEWLQGTSADPALAAKVPRSRNVPYKSPSKSPARSRQ